MIRTSERKEPRESTPLNPNSRGKPIDKKIYRESMQHIHSQNEPLENTCTNCFLIGMIFCISGPFMLFDHFFEQ